MKHFILSILISLSCVFSAYAQLSEKNKAELIDKVKTSYCNNETDGCSVYKIHRKYVIVTTVTTNDLRSRFDILQRKCQIRAYRDICEFVNGINNKSVTTYTLRDSDLFTHNNVQSDDNDLADNVVEVSTISTNTDNNVISNEDSFSDNITITSVGHINNVQCIASINNGVNKTFIFIKVI